MIKLWITGSSFDGEISAPAEKPPERHGSHLSYCWKSSNSTLSLHIYISSFKDTQRLDLLRRLNDFNVNEPSPGIQFFL